METMSIHFFCNTKRSSVNNLCNAISNAFPCKFMPYFRRYKFFVISCRIRVYMGVLCVNHVGMKLLRNVFMN